MTFVRSILCSALLAVACLLATHVTLANMGGEEETTSTEPNYVEGKKALEAKDFKAAIAALEKAAAADKSNADIHNYLGFAYRNAGDLDKAFKHYKQALMLAPGHKGANEYIGEAYLLSGDLAKAEEHFNKLKQICVTGCSELSLLKEKIEEYKKKKS
jgi:Flp pilus assembly protein TadD